MRIAKSIMLALSVLLLVSWAFSAVGIAWVPLAPRSADGLYIDGYSIALAYGGIAFEDKAAPEAANPVRFVQARGFAIGAVPETGPSTTMFFNSVRPVPYRGFYYLPFWIPTSAVLAITGWLFIVGRSSVRGRGGCICGYNLTGNTSGRCPECGTAIAAAQS